jgi:catechol 2,3-dioxygenase-like lactoylglutathione lyase family enzyme
MKSCSNPQRGRRHALMSLDHVSLTVRNVNRSIEFYKAVGLTLLRISTLRRTVGKHYTNAYMYGDHFMLELLPLRGGNRRHKKPPVSAERALHGSIGMNHLGIRVRNLGTAVKKLQAAGAELVGQPFRIDREASNVDFFDDESDSTMHYVRRPGKRPWRIALFSDPDGVLVELVER